MKLFNRAKEQAFTTELKEIYKVAEQQWIADFNEYPEDTDKRITFTIYNYNYASFQQGTVVFCKIHNNTLSCFHD